MPGYPISHIFLAEEIDASTMKTNREVVDGQQRISTILQYVNNSFKILKVHNEEVANLFFKDLPDEQKELILLYEIPCQVFSTKDKNIIYDIFARLNTFNYALNSQELRNANYFGTFKTIVEKIRLAIFDEIEELGLYKDMEIRRMKLQEDLARILIFYLESYVNDSDKSINNFYEKYDNDDTFSNALDALNSVIYIYREAIDIFKKIINLNGSLLSFDRKYFFTIFMLLIEIKKWIMIKLQNSLH
ncbi:MAG: DUF262 domain-containing protein [Spiroplasma poulsonii]|nr:DUF262 domain-containing protein [Spiroplasma poulsonii]MBH8623448.1 DUF262 domain-containing protein [Spiroplasma sp. hyd1]MBW1241976.1 DUF262 domain-containing protein [Spiroplasma poulsonii]